MLSQLVCDYYSLGYFGSKATFTVAGIPLYKILLMNKMNKNILCS